MNTQAALREKQPDERIIDRKFLADVLEGLSRTAKTLPCKYFYDKRGSELFEQICGLDEYYVTRTELEIMETWSHEMADAVGPGADVLEFGSGNGVKTRLLLDALDSPGSYTPMDISEDILHQSSITLRREFPAITISPVLADYTEPFPPLDIFNALNGARKLVYFPGSTLGNFTAGEAASFLTRVAGLLTEGDGLLIGLDLVKNEAVLNLAYDDPGGITAEFNLNLLHRIVHELGADFNPAHFGHRAKYNPDFERVEMFLVSDRDQIIEIDDARIEIKRGESIHTENSHKYTVKGFDSLAESCGFQRCGFWTDRLDYFGVFYLEKVAG